MSGTGSELGASCWSNLAHHEDVASPGRRAKTTPQTEGSAFGAVDRLLGSSALLDHSLQVLNGDESLPQKRP